MKQNLVKVIVLSLLSVFIFWVPFISKTEMFWGIDFGKQGMNVVIQNFDGLNFLVVAKSLYDPKIISEINAHFLTGNEPIYFSAHYPLYALIIRAFEQMLSLPHALLATIILGNILLPIGLYYFFETVSKNKRLALITSSVALFFPARMLAVRAVGSNEPYFIFFVLMSLALAYKKKYWLSTVLGSLAIITRSPGILLFVGYLIAGLASYRTKIRKMVTEGWPYLLMPTTLILLFGFYGSRYGSWLAYFQSGDNLHLFFPPFMIFSNVQSWISDMWREDIVYLYLFYGVGLIQYIKTQRKSCGLDKLATAGYGVIYGIVILLIAHRDLARYALPLAPIALLGYAPLLEKTSKKTWLLLSVLIVPIYLLGWQFVLANIQPISDWSIFF